MKRVVVEMTLDGVPDEAGAAQLVVTMVNALYAVKMATASHWSVTSEGSKLEGLSVKAGR